eukprot:gnl/TRDRNA2_/TRDRNA2_173415_c0_seq5.p1 gnl/TRDRNA2_/TRDRNA2_173415_c0~~gnl/TRDRNA2_/TRDRNA2_173415_c0_seq5.p1  ORF type:complete len:180 (-),score=44.87 gnl/TRDRNA2_/TRDRNA2_173415_c0_seq5:241-780(-)
MRSITAVVVLAVFAATEAQILNARAQQKVFMQRPQRSMLPPAKAGPIDPFGIRWKNTPLDEKVGGDVSEAELGKMTGEASSMIPGSLAAVKRTDGAWKYAQLYWKQSNPTETVNKYTFWVDQSGRQKDFYDEDMDGVKTMPLNLAEAPTDIISIPAAAFIGLVMGSGATFAFVRSRGFA